MMQHAEAVRRYVHYFENLSPESLNELGAYCSPDIRFEDPFNKAVGVDSVAAIFWHMFENADDPRFEVHDWSVSGEAGFIFWTFSCYSFGRDFRFDGVSRVRVDDEGRISEHIDYWDTASALWYRIPVLGWVLRLLARRFRVQD
jgi:steroid delta-isomerase